MFRYLLSLFTLGNLITQSFIARRALSSIEPGAVLGDYSGYRYSLGLALVANL